MRFRNLSAAGSLHRNRVIICMLQMDNELTREDHGYVQEQTGAL